MMLNGTNGTWRMALAQYISTSFSFSSLQGHWMYIPIEVFDDRYGVIGIADALDTQLMRVQRVTGCRGTLVRHLGRLLRGHYSQNQSQERGMADKVAVQICSAHGVCSCLVEVGFCVLDVD